MSFSLEIGVIEMSEEEHVLQQTIAATLQEIYLSSNKNSFPSYIFRLDKLEFSSSNSGTDPLIFTIYLTKH